MKKKLEVKNKMELEAEEGENYEGKHNFMILEVNFNDTDYGQYAELTLGFEDEEADFEPTVGFPAKISPNTQLGKLIEEVDGELQIGEGYDLEEILVGESIEAELIQNEDGFYEVVKDKNGKLPITHKA